MAPEDPATREALATAEGALARGDPKAALGALDVVDASAAAGAGPTSVTVARAAFVRGQALWSLGKREGSATAFLAAADAATAIGWVCAVAKAAREAGNVRYDLAEYARAVLEYERARKASEETGDLRGLAGTLRGIGNARLSLRDARGATAALERSLAVARRSGDRLEEALTLSSLGSCRLDLRDLSGALARYEESLALSEAVGDEAASAMTLGNIGLVLEERGDLPDALDAQERALAVKRRIGDRAGEAATLVNVGNVRIALSDYAEALEAMAGSLALRELLHDRAGRATSLLGLGNVLEALGEYAEAQRRYEESLELYEALGDRAGTGFVLGNLGRVTHNVGDAAKAVEFYERALRISEETGERGSAWIVLRNLGDAHADLGDSAAALERYERALRIAEELGDRVGAAGVIADMARLRMRRGEPRAALEGLERALVVAEEFHDRRLAARILGNLGLAQRRLGNADAALACTRRALAGAEEIGEADVVATAHEEIASLALARGAHGEAADHARKAFETGDRLAKGLGDVQGADARTGNVRVCEIGAAASYLANDPAGLCWFLENSRGRGLLEALGGRERMRAVVVPEVLRHAEARAQAAEAAALAALQRAVESGDRAAIVRMREGLAVARDAVQDAVERIQREAKAAAQVAYPRPASIEDVRASLREGDAFVLYGTGRTGAVALVVTPTKERIVPLGDAGLIDSFCELLVPHGKPFVAPEAVPMLRALLVEPLGLEPTVKRLLVSPHGSMSYVPFGLLAPDLEVAYEPSGAIHAWLASDPARAGEGVLALGDPEHGGSPPPRLVAASRGGGDLPRLPGTREEARAVGDVLLLGADASAAGLRAALPRRPRWRSVHLACHALVDPERPAQSALVLTPSGDDGFLTALDVFELPVPADLVVLSACETGKGKVVEGEGIVGLARAFMYAGSPRLICSLWKVDDQATRALMTRFYALWNPRTGSKGLGTAAALRQAQAYVRDLEVERVDDEASQAAGREVRAKVRPFAHPQYWAAWVLWGLAD